MLQKLIFIFSFSILISLHTFSVNAGIENTYDFSWLDPDKEIFVLQNRRYRKDDRFNISLGAGTTTSGAFVDSFNFQVRGSYFFEEDIGIELLYASNSGKENETASAVRNPGGAGSTPFRRIVESYFGAYFSWSPFYAKINTFNKIIYLDWILNVGYAYMNEENNKDEVISGSVGNYTTLAESHHSFSWDLALKFYINQSFDVRVDLTALHYQAISARNLEDESKNWYSHYDLTVSFGYSF